MIKQKEVIDDDEVEDGGKGGKFSGRRKFVYVGGFVLDFKKGINIKKVLVIIDLIIKYL